MTSSFEALFSSASDQHGTTEDLTLATANELIRVCREIGVLPEPARLELFMYFASGWSLALRERRLITEPIYATAVGPMILGLRKGFGHWRGMPVLDFAKRFDKGLGRFVTASIEPIEVAHELRTFLFMCCKAFRKASVDDLRRIAMEPDSPWAIARMGVPEHARPVIHPETIERHFIKIAAELSAAQKKQE